jgi:sensor domain CHASE-containing protein
MASGDPELSRLVVFGLILALIGIVVLFIVALIFTVSPSSYDSNIDTMKYTISAGIILIVIGAGISVVMYVHQ